MRILGIVFLALLGARIIKGMEDRQNYTPPLKNIAISDNPKEGWYLVRATNSPTLTDYLMDCMTVHQMSLYEAVNQWQLRAPIKTTLDDADIAIQLIRDPQGRPIEWHYLN